MLNKVLFNKFIYNYISILAIYKWKKLFFVMVTFLLLLNISIIANEEEENLIESTLEWESVKSAKGYHVQIRNSKKKLVVDEKVNTTKYTMNLPEGDYEERVGVYNKFGKIVGYSDWEKISINKVFNPKIDSLSKIIYNDTSPQTIEINGNYFTSDSKIILKSSNNKINILEVIFKSEKKIEVVIKIEDTLQGNFDLIIINPRNKRAQALNYLQILDKNIQASLQKEQIINQRNKKSFNPVPEKNSRYNGIRSAMLPGYGQFNKNQKIKAGIFTVAFLGSFSYFATQYVNYNDYKNKYDRSTNEGILFSTNQQNLTNGVVLYNLYQSNQYLGEAESSGLRASQALAFVNVIYIVNILDAIYSNSETDVAIKPGFQLHSNFSLQAFSPGNPSNSQYELGLKWNF